MSTKTKIEITISDEESKDDLIQFLQMRPECQIKVIEDPYKHQRNWQNTKYQTDAEYRERVKQHSKLKAAEKYATDESFRIQRSEANRKQYLRRKNAHLNVDDNADVQSHNQLQGIEQFLSPIPCVR